MRKALHTSVGYTIVLFASLFLWGFHIQFSDNTLSANMLYFLPMVVGFPFLTITLRWADLEHLYGSMRAVVVLAGLLFQIFSFFWMARLILKRKE